MPNFEGGVLAWVVRYMPTRSLEMWPFLGGVIESMGTDWRGEEYAAESGHHRSFDDWFLGQLMPEPTDVVVDLGCGSGEFTSRVAEVVTGGKVIGVEPDPSMLETARRYTNRGLEFIAASAEDLDSVVAPGTVDKVLSRAMLHWVPVDRYPRVFEAVRRVLRPGGWFHSESAGAGNVPLLASLLGDLARRFSLEDLPSFPDAGTAFDYVEQAGFEIPNDGVRTIAQRRPFTREQALGLLRTQGAVALTRQADEEQGASIVAAALADVEKLRRGDGTFDQTFVRLEILARVPE